MSTTPLRRSFVFNLTYPVMRLAVALVTVPIYIHHVGDARYGVVSIVWTLLGYFGFLDLGLSRASTNALSKLRDGPQSDRARVLLTTITLNFCFGLVGTILIYFVGGYLFEHVLSVPDALKPEVEGALPWIACLFPMALVSGSAMGALESRERFLTANLFQMFSMILSQVAPVIIAVFVSPSLMVVIPSVAIAQGFGIIIQLAYIYRVEGPISLKTFDGAEARKLLGYGGWVTVSSVISPILVSADQFLIGSLIGVAGVAHYAVPMNLVVRTQIVPGALARTFFPRMSVLSRDAARELGGARASVPRIWLCGDMRPRDCHFASLFSILDRTRFRADRGAGRANPFYRRVDQWPGLCEWLHPYPGPRTSRFDRKTAHRRDLAVPRDPVDSYVDVRS